MYVKKDTGEEVTDAYAKRYPHLVKKVREPKVVVAEEPVEAPTEVSADWTPVLGEFCEHNGEVIALTSLDPLTATVYRREGGVQTTNDYPLESLDDVQPLTKEEAYRRVF